MKNPNEGPNNPEQNFGIMGAVERLELYYRTPYLAVDLNSWSIFYRKRLIKNCLLELWHDVDENWVVIPEEERQECSDMIEYFIMQISFDNGHCPLDVPFKYEYAIPQVVRVHTRRNRYTADHSWTKYGGPANGYFPQHDALVELVLYLCQFFMPHTAIDSDYSYEQLEEDRLNGPHTIEPPFPPLFSRGPLESQNTDSCSANRELEELDEEEMYS